MIDYVDIDLNEVSKKIKGMPVKQCGKTVGKIIGVSYTEGCRHEGAKIDITAEITNKKMEDKLWRIRFV